MTSQTGAPPQIEMTGPRLPGQEGTAAAGAWISYPAHGEYHEHVSLAELGKLRSLEVPGHTMAEVARDPDLREQVTPGEWPVEELAGDIRRYGFEEPARVELNRTEAHPHYGTPFFGDGHYRFMAAWDAGWTHLPVRYRDEETRAAAYRLWNRCHARLEPAAALVAASGRSAGGPAPSRRRTAGRARSRSLR